MLFTLYERNIIWPLLHNWGFFTNYLELPKVGSVKFSFRVSRKEFSFIWEGVEEKAKLITKKSDERIRWKWLESEDDDSFFEIRIEVDPLTKDVSLIVTDFADDEDEVEESKQLWENQIDELKHTIGA